MLLLFCLGFFLSSSFSSSFFFRVRRKKNCCFAAAAAATRLLLARKKERKFAMKFDCWSSLKRKLYEEAGVMSDNDLALSFRVLLLIHADCIDRQVKARPS